MKTSTSSSVESQDMLENIRQSISILSSAGVFTLETFIQCYEHMFGPLEFRREGFRSVQELLFCLPKYVDVQKASDGTLHLSTPNSKVNCSNAKKDCIVPHRWH